MRKAGFCSIGWGLESGSQRVLDLMNKGISIHSASRILEASKRNKISNSCMIILNFPGETAQDIEKTIGFLKDHAGYIDRATYTQFILNRWEPIYKNYNKLRKKYQKESMKRKELDSLINRLNLEDTLGLAEPSSDNKYTKSLSWYFYNASWEPLSKSDIITSLRKKKFSKVFPLILGEFKRINNKTVFYPINIKQPRFINLIIPSKRVILDEIEEKVIYLSEGYHSIEEIFAELNNLSSEKYGKRYVINKCINLLEKVYKNDLGLGYKRSLRL